jgi:hypothetical protein
MQKDKIEHRGERVSGTRPDVFDYNAARQRMLNYALNQR